MPWIEDKSAQTKAAAITGAQKTGAALLSAKNTTVNGVNISSF